MATEDRIVAEMDVFSCRTLLGEDIQTALFQYPLRPPWRPYDMAEKSKIKVKPNAKKIEMSVPLDTKGENYNEDVEGAMQLEQLTLRSKPTILDTSYAVAQIREGKVYLMPIDEATQLRPYMSHLDEPVLKDDTQDAPNNSEPELVALQVQVQRRETERQIQNKLNSHAYISKLEAEEKWIDVDLSGVQAADSFWQKMSCGPQKEVDMSLSRKAYLSSLMPPAYLEEEEALTHPVSPRSINNSGKPQPLESKSKSAAKSEGLPKTEISGPQVELSEKESRALEAEFTSMFRHSAVHSLASVRQWLQDSCKRPELEKFAEISDSELHSALTQITIVQNIGTTYIHLPSDSPTIKSFREIVIRLLASKGSVRKAEIMEAVRKGNLEMTEAQCMRSIKDICKSQGTSWHLKF